MSTARARGKAMKPFGAFLRIASSACLMGLVAASLALAASRADLERDGKRALQDLYATNSAAALLGKKAKAVLVFPRMVKAGFLFGGQIGEGVLLRGGRPSGFYNSVAASYGLQAGGQVFGYALFFMNEGALSYLDRSEGFEVGVGPSIVVVDEGMGKSLTSTTLTQDVYAFIFAQKGLMAGVGIQGSKITRIEK
ncbi:MAG: lipid-binding SYLF domain-containing protein [Thermodesulfobacteriota bacterium]